MEIAPSGPAPISLYRHLSMLRVPSHSTLNPNPSEMQELSSSPFIEEEIEARGRSRTEK